MECKIKFIDEKLKEAFLNLEKSDPRLYKEIAKALEDISKNAYCGRNVKKNLIPNEFIQKYDINNLWIYNLRVDWRLLYSVSNNEIDVLGLILDWMNHKDYERLFGF
jgi:Txe/YoeB family toxin of Txe-Axe toxin-antitoxin module